jgi:hypothetical protein
VDTRDKNNRKNVGVIIIFMSKEAGVLEVGFDYQDEVKDCPLFKIASKIVEERQNENTFLEEKGDRRVLFGYVDEKGKDKNSQYKVFGISEDKTEECLLRAMEINQHENTGVDQEKIESRSTMTQSVFLTANINCF